MPARGRQLGTRLLAASVAVSALLFGAATPAMGEPSTAAQAHDELERLHQEAGRLEESFAEASIELSKGEKRLAALRADLAAQQQRVDLIADQTRQIALTQFRSRGVDDTAALFVSGDPDSFLRTLSTTQKVAENMNATVQRYQTEQANLDDLRRSMEAEVESLAKTKAEAEELLAQGRERQQEMSRTLERLTDEERAAVAAVEDEGVVATDATAAKAVVKKAATTAPAPVSGATDSRAAKAVQYVISKVGKSQYVWGAEGPSSFDCSGLMLAAYKTAGVSLPHSSRAQFGAGKAVSRSDLRPGDLVFWYSPISHVGMYIGDGKIVHARNTRVDIVMQTLKSYPAPYTGARRIVG
ncbi:MAG: NlpC/P60 family protein [Propioniciclava sp.]